ncbi:hypothetical protein BKA70DRAFT_1399646 [Coprinopsis sp. MPI-PUGE-AT-0042]|nr:hypothetical protein BKA70DRAFT_1399646 [Coprinopsis sp. MPI-PUGE-AT-0042]
MSRGAGSSAFAAQGSKALLKRCWVPKTRRAAELRVFAFAHARNANFRRDLAWVSYRSPNLRSSRQCFDPTLIALRTDTDTKREDWRLLVAGLQQSREKIVGCWDTPSPHPTSIPSSTTFRIAAGPTRWVKPVKSTDSAPAKASNQMATSLVCPPCLFRGGAVGFDVDDVGCIGLRTSVAEGESAWGEFVIESSAGSILGLCSASPDPRDAFSSCQGFIKNAIHPLEERKTLENPTTSASGCLLLHPLPTVPNIQEARDLGAFWPSTTPNFSTSSFSSRWFASSGGRINHRPSPCSTAPGRPERLGLRSISADAVHSSNEDVASTTPAFDEDRATFGARIDKQLKQIPLPNDYNSPTSTNAFSASAPRSRSLCHTGTKHACSVYHFPLGRVEFKPHYFALIQSRPSLLGDSSDLPSAAMRPSYRWTTRPQRSRQRCAQHAQFDGSKFIVKPRWQQPCEDSVGMRKPLTTFAREPKLCSGSLVLEASRRKPSCFRDTIDMTIRSTLTSRGHLIRSNNDIVTVAYWDLVPDGV